MKKVVNGVFEDMTDADIAKLSVARAISPNQITEERNRRLGLGFDYDFGDARGVHRFGTTEADLKGWDEVTKIALSRKALNTITTILIATDTGPAVVTPAEWLAVLEASAAFRQPIWQASFALEATDPIPSDFTDDKHWP